VDGTTHGLGLSITKRIVDEHGGVVETSSDPSRGTRFRIVLPRSLPLTELEALEAGDTPISVRASAP
jgi:signal transduction histidine kinase